MMDRLEEAVMRGEEASRILNSRIFDAAFIDTKAALFNVLGAMDNLSSDQARDTHSMIRALDKVRRCLQVHIETGMLASKEIEHRSRLNPFKRRA